MVQERSATGRWWLMLPLLLFCAALIEPAQAANLEKVSIRMDWVINGYHAPFFVGVEKGFYKDEGLDVTVEPGNGSSVVAQAIGNGNGTFGYVDGGTMMTLVSKGLHVKAVMGIVQKSPLSVVYNAKRGINKPKDLEGKKIGASNGEAPLIMLPAFLKATGVDESKITIVNTSPASKEAILLNGQVDGDVEFDFVVIPPLEAHGMSVKAFDYADYGVNVPGTSIIARDDYLASHPDVVRRFLRATAKAYDWTVQHPEQAIDILIAANPDKKIPKDIALKVLELSLKDLHTKATQGKPVGVMSAEDWKHGEELLVKYQGIKPLGDPSHYMTNAFLESK
jgi:NitT/TauT family transport system substrate-binding protein